MELATLIFLVQLGATWTMVGLIWFVQIVHYPLFGGVGESAFVRYESDHQRLTTWVVVPPMISELGAAALQVVWRPDHLHPSLVWIGLALAIAIWVITFTVQVPLHGKLSDGFDSKHHRRLVNSNWLRTFAWTARGLLLLWMLSQMLAR